MLTRKTNLSHRRMYIETDFHISCINKGDNVSASRISCCYSCLFLFANHSYYQTCGMSFRKKTRRINCDRVSEIIILLLFYQLVNFSMVGFNKIYTCSEG